MKLVSSYTFWESRNRNWRSGRRDYDEIEKKNFGKFSFIVSQHMAVHHGAFDVGGDCIHLLVVNQFTVNLVFLSLVKNMIQHSSDC